MHFPKRSHVHHMIVFFRTQINFHGIVVVMWEEQPQSTILPGPSKLGL